MSRAFWDTLGHMSRRALERELTELVTCHGLPSVIHSLVEVCYASLSVILHEAPYCPPDYDHWSRVEALQRVAEQLTTLEAVLRWGPP